MPDFRLSRLAALTLALGLAVAPAPALLAQDAPAADAPADAPAADAPAADAATPNESGAATDFNTGEEVGGGAGQVGQTYVTDTSGDWEIRCVRTPDGFDPCQLYQLLHDQEGNPVSEFSMVALPSGGNAAAGATVITPLETLLTAQLTFQVDGSKARRYPFTWCAQVGCFSRIGFTDAEVTQLKKGNKAVLTIVPMVAPDQKVELTVSLSGFTAGFEKMREKNAETQKLADEAQKAAGGGEAPAEGSGN